VADGSGVGFRAVTESGYSAPAYWYYEVSYDLGATWTFRSTSLFSYIPFNYAMDWIITE
jgi:hypothetical protein